MCPNIDYEPILANEYVELSLVENLYAQINLCRCFFFFLKQENEVEFVWGGINTNTSNGHQWNQINKELFAVSRCINGFFYLRYLNITQNKCISCGLNSRNNCGQFPLSLVLNACKIWKII